MIVSTEAPVPYANDHVLHRPSVYRTDPTCERFEWVRLELCLMVAIVDGAGSIGRAFCLCGQ
jgi:hypothetical protein